MSDIRGGGAPRRRKRADAQRIAAAVLDAAIDLLGRQPDASIDDIAKNAGVARQTVYAHYPSRDALLAAVIDRITSEVLAAFATADLDQDTPAGALRRWLETSWSLIERYPILLTPAATATSPQHEHDRHLPITESLQRLIQRGQDTGEFDPALSPHWLIATTIAIGHAAGQEVAAGRMTSRDAGAAFRISTLRVYATK